VIAAQHLYSPDTLCEAELTVLLHFSTINTSTVAVRHCTAPQSPPLQPRRGRASDSPRIREGTTNHTGWLEFNFPFQHKYWLYQRRQL